MSDSELRIPDGFAFFDENRRFYTNNEDGSIVSATIMRVVSRDVRELVTLVGYHRSGDPIESIKWVTREAFIETHTVLEEGD